MQCPKCGSENCQRLSVIFQGGTQSINITGGTSATSQTGLARRVAPPVKKSFIYFIPVAFAGVVLFIYGMIGQGFLELIGLVCGGIGAYGIFSAIKYNMNKYPRNYHYWSNQWLCHKCGNIYHQEL